jgi:hypothetical protein
MAPAELLDEDGDEEVGDWIDELLDAEPESQDAE